jgi:hypothetical protein
LSNPQPIPKKLDYKSSPKRTSNQGFQMDKWIAHLIWVQSTQGTNHLPIQPNKQW